MSNPQPEPSMEEILASIRRIISEDGEDEQDAPNRVFQRQGPDASRDRPAPGAVKPPAASQSAAGEEARAERDTGTEDIEMIKRNVAEAMQEDSMQEDSEDDILDATAAAAASKAFHSLSQSVKVSSGDARTLEDIVVEMLRPLVKEWLDANLPAIVEEKVEEEVQRLARRRR